MAHAVRPPPRAEKTARTLEQRIEAEKRRAKLDERRSIRRFIEAGRRGENPFAWFCAVNPSPIAQPPPRREYKFTYVPAPEETDQ